ncbi:MAG: hypothetical protein EBU32_12520, partial [Opitutaceae bacterium]|nr:hypothetical protein [Opitutaceae bacterium]
MGSYIFVVWGQSVFLSANRSVFVRRFGKNGSARPPRYQPPPHRQIQSPKRFSSSTVEEEQNRRKMSYNASKVIEEVSQENWPAARVRNIVKVFEEQRSLQWMLDAPAPKRMTREKGLEWLAATAGIPLVDLKLMRPVPFVQQYVLGTREHQSLIQAIRIVHGITARAMYSPEKDCASDYMIERARWWIASEENAPRAPAPAPAEVIAEAPAPAPAEV